MAFAASREGAPADRDFELFHRCRLPDCKFAGSRNTDYLGLERGPRAVLHVHRSAFSENTAVAVPLGDLHGPVAAVNAVRYSRKAMAGLVISVLSLAIRSMQSFSEISASKAASGLIAFVFKVVLGNLVTGFTDVENGSIDGMATFYWGGRPAWATWLTLGLLYVGATWYYGGHAKLAILAKPTTQASIVHPDKAPSAPASDTDDRSCQASSLYMSLPHKRSPLCQSPRSGNRTEMALLLREDHWASRYPKSDLEWGLPLCGAHRDIYHDIMSNQVCNGLQCMRLGLSWPDGKQ